MSALIYTLLANELDISDEKAKKLVTAMLGEVRKRARREGVRLPDLGKFSEKDGRLTFEPSESLARAVNHRFEGLDTEDLGPVRDKEEDNAKDEGPSTITLGYQNSGWSPLDPADTAEPSEEEAEPDAQEEPDTEEFEVPSADDAADTQELQAASPSDTPQSEEQDTTSKSEPEPSTSDSDEPPTETEELYPLVEDVPGSEAEPASSSADPDGEEDTERETLSGIWNSEDKGEDDDATEEAAAHDTSEPSSWPETEASEPWTTDAEPPAQEETPVEDRTRTETAGRSAETRSESTSTRPDEDRSSTPRILVTLLVLFMLGGAAWYVLGQQGLVPTPRSTFAQVRSHLGPQVSSLPLVGSSSQDETDGSLSDSSQQTASSQDVSSSDSDAPAQGSRSDDGPESQTSDDASSAEVSASSSSTPQSGPRSEIDPSAGGWTIVVASRADRSGASSLAETFRERFASQQLPIDVIPGIVDNSTRYRVGIGQFDSQSEAERFVEEFETELPDGAWTLRLE